MLEKDIENLIARYPDEFLPNSGLILEKRQFRVRGRIIDIIFSDKHGRVIVVEVKRGILSRDAAGQIMEYYGLLKEEYPNQIIELILCANVIPHERRTFLERAGIECKELGVSFIQEIAKKYYYHFLDEIQPEMKVQYKENTQEIDRQISVGSLDVWIFQANPRRYDILNYLSNEELQEDWWEVKRFKDRIKKWDIGLIWMSATGPKAKDAGIYALAEIMSNPKWMGEPETSTKYWMSDEDKNQIRLRVVLKYTLKFVNNPILREELKSIPELIKMDIFKQPQGTNFQVTQNEWQVISKIIKDKLK